MSDTAQARSVGIIMDGNRRWAASHEKPSLEGHRAGLAKTKEIVRHAFSRGVDTVILYAFSTENWNRTPEEVGYLMNLFTDAIAGEFASLAEEGMSIRFIGDKSRLPEAIRTAAEKLEEDSRVSATGKTLCIALSYGGRAEILSAVNQLLAEGATEVTEEVLGNALWTARLPDPDLIIRTGGEQRLSNFLPWQSVYSELFFTDSYWPDFTKEEFDSILAEFSARERRHGK